jgi:nucleolar pre-ribosomal-associated protein 1
MHLLNLLKDTLPPPSEAPPIRLPSYTSLILLHALRGIFYPSNFTYPLTANFLLQRPELDTNDVPMLYAMLYSSSDDWKKERAWVIRFLSDGMLGSGDWRVLKRRHTWDLLASFFQSTDKNRSLRHGILEVLSTSYYSSSMVMVLDLGACQLDLQHPSDDVVNTQIGAPDLD